MNRNLRTNWRCYLAVGCLMLMSGPLSPLTASAASPPLTASIYADHKVTGTVIDGTGMAVPGATVTILKNGFKRATSTDANGRFILQEIAAGNYELEVQMLGYTKYQQAVTVNADQNLNITLSSSATNLSDVIVVGYGTQKKASVTSSVETVSAKQIENRAVPNVINILQGEAAGLNIQQTNANPGYSSTSIDIRGTSSLSNNPVLYIVDGMAVAKLDYLNPSDIASVSILKDASATAIYGARASGGVVLVTTKTGKPNAAPQLQYSAMVGSQRPARLPKFVEAPEFVDLYNQAQLNDNPGGTVKYSPELVQKYKSGELPSTNWLPYILNNSAFQQQHNLSVSGGGKSVDYYVSGGFLDQGGLIKNVGYKRYSTRAAVNVQVTDRLKLGVNTVLVKEDKLQPSSYGVGSALQWSYIVPVTEFPYTAGGNDRSYRGGAQPNDILTKGGVKNEAVNTINTNFLAEYKIMDGLVLNGTYGYNYTNGFVSAFYNRYPLYNDNEQIVVYVNNPNSVLKQNYATTHPTSLLTLNYAKTINKHEFKALLGYSQESDRYDFNQIRRYSFLTNNIDQVDAGSNDPTLSNVSGNATAYSVQSVFGRVNYAFAGKYLLEGNVRYDGTSVFKNKRFGFFPSVSGGWLASEENFLRDVEAISFLKLRASWGKVGNQNASGLYPWANTIAQSTYIFNNTSNPTTYYNNAANPDLTWEVKTSANIGFDVTLLRNLTVSADIFRDITTGIIRSPSVPTTYGIGAPQQNVGKMRNQGFEVTLGYKNKIGDLSYRASFNISDSKNKILDLGGTAPTYGENPIVEGHSRWEWYGLKAEGLFQNQAQIDNHATQNPRTKPGDIAFQDVNNDGKINSDDRVFLGQAVPHYRYGFSLNLEYKNFDFSMLLQGVMSNLARVTGGAQVPFFYNGDGNILTSQLDYWTPDNPGARYPLLRTDQSVNNSQLSSWWLFKASYLRFKNVQVGYTIPSKIAKKAGLSTARIFVAGDNLFVLTSKNFPKVLDPEIANFSDGSSYPQVRNISLGLNIGF